MSSSMREFIINVKLEKLKADYLEGKIKNEDLPDAYERAIESTKQEADAWIDKRPSFDED